MYVMQPEQTNVSFITGVKHENNNRIIVRQMAEWVVMIGKPATIKFLLIDIGQGLSVH